MARCKHYVIPEVPAEVPAEKQSGRLLMPVVPIAFVRVGYRQATLAPTCFDASAFRVRRPEKTGSDRFHGVVVVRGLNHPESDQDRRAPMGASPVGFDYTTLAAASGRRCVK